MSDTDLAPSMTVDEAAAVLRDHIKDSGSPEWKAMNALLDIALTREPAEDAADVVTMRRQLSEVLGLPDEHRSEQAWAWMLAKVEGLVAESSG